MKIAPIAEIKAKLSEFLNKCRTEPVVITRNGRAAALLVPVIDDEHLERLVLANTPRFRKLLTDAERRIRQTGGINHKNFWRPRPSAKPKRKRIRVNIATS